MVIAFRLCAEGKTATAIEDESAGAGAVVLAGPSLSILGVVLLVGDESGWPASLLSTGLLLLDSGDVTMTVGPSSFLTEIPRLAGSGNALLVQTFPKSVCAYVSKIEIS